MNDISCEGVGMSSWSIIGLCWFASAAALSLLLLFAPRPFFKNNFFLAFGVGLCIFTAQEVVFHALGPLVVRNCEDLPGKKLPFFNLPVRLTLSASQIEEALFNMEEKPRVLNVAFDASGRMRFEAVKMTLKLRNKRCDARPIFLTLQDSEVIVVKGLCESLSLEQCKYSSPCARVMQENVTTCITTKTSNRGIDIERSMYGKSKHFELHPLQSGSWYRPYLFTLLAIVMMCTIDFSRITRALGV